MKNLWSGKNNETLYFQLPEDITVKQLIIEAKTGITFAHICRIDGGLKIEN